MGRALVPSTWVVCAALALAGCKTAEPVASPPPPQVAQADVEDAAQQRTSGSVAPAPRTAQDLYEGCRERVEGVEAAGECSADADCVRSGCSQEMCISKTAAESGIMSTCEVLPCFSVLGACGCQAGVCQWTLADAPAGGAPPPGGPIPFQHLPPKNP